MKYKTVPVKRHEEILNRSHEQIQAFSLEFIIIINYAHYYQHAAFIIVHKKLYLIHYAEVIVLVLNTLELIFYGLQQKPSTFKICSQINI